MAILFFVAALLVTPGCSRQDANRAAIRGEVKLDGELLDKGAILFVPIDGAKGAVTGGPIENGQYRISGDVGAAVGWNRVEIRSSRTTGKTIQYAPGTSPSVEVIQRVAPRFNANSTLKTEVKTEENTADFDVASK
jgi:hypothetical protein